MTKASFTLRNGQVRVGMRMSKTGHFRGGFITRASISASSWRRLYRLFCENRASHGGGWYSFQW